MSKQKDLLVSELKTLIKQHQSVNCPKLPSRKADLQKLAQKYNIPTSKRSSIRLEKEQKKSNAIAKVGTKAYLVDQLVKLTGKTKSHFTKMTKGQLDEMLQYETFSPPPPPPLPTPQKPKMPSRPPPMRPLEMKETNIPEMFTSSIQNTPISQVSTSKSGKSSSISVDKPILTRYPNGIRPNEIIVTLTSDQMRQIARDKLKKKLKKKEAERKSKK
jgi:hypothetical protein